MLKVWCWKWKSDVEKEILFWNKEIFKNLKIFAIKKRIDQKKTFKK